jgi:LEA14-like dessication related protein
MKSVTWRWSWTFLTLGCTPLGLWLYEDPVITVSRITLELAPRSTHSPVTVALELQNTNDYPVSAERVELALQLDGVPVGQLMQDSTVPVATDTVSQVALSLPLGRQATPQRLQTWGSGTHKFAVRGRAIFKTPIGKRKVPFTQEGTMVFATRSPLGSAPWLEQPAAGAVNQSPSESPRQTPPPPSPEK